MLRIDSASSLFLAIFHRNNSKYLRKALLISAPDLLYIFCILDWNWFSWKNLSTMVRFTCTVLYNRPSAISAETPYRGFFGTHSILLRSRSPVVRGHLDWIPYVLLLCLFFDRLNRQTEHNSVNHSPTNNSRDQEITTTGACCVFLHVLWINGSEINCFYDFKNLSFPAHYSCSRFFQIYRRFDLPKNLKINKIGTPL